MTLVNQLVLSISSFRLKNMNIHFNKPSINVFVCFSYCTVHACDSDINMLKNIRS